MVVSTLATLLGALLGVLLAHLLAGLLASLWLARWRPLAWLAWARRAPMLRAMLWTAWALESSVRAAFRAVAMVQAGPRKPRAGWTVDTAVAAARKLPRDAPGDQAKADDSDDFDDRLHETGLALALSDFQASDMSFFARFLPLGPMLHKKLCVERLLRRNAVARDSPLPPLVFIVSLPRTGSTWLHSLCDLDPGARTLKAWELKLPTSCTPQGQATAAERRERVRKLQEALYKMVPRLKLIHHVLGDSPDECVQGFTDGFFPDNWAWGMVDMPATRDYYMTHSMADQYRNFERLARAVLHDERETCAPGPPPAYDKLVLKSPHHILKVDDLARVFPGATVLWLHRDPVEVVGSCCSMNQAALDAVSPSMVDPKVLGLRTLHSLAAAQRVGAEQRRALEARPGGSPLRFVDVHLLALRKDPAGTLRAAYQAADLPFSPAFEAALDEQRAARQAAKSGGAGRRHEYDLAEFGLSEELVRAVM